MVLTSAQPGIFGMTTGRRSPSVRLPRLLNDRAPAPGYQRSAASSNVLYPHRLLLAFTSQVAYRRRSRGQYRFTGVVANAPVKPAMAASPISMRQRPSRQQPLLINHPISPGVAAESAAAHFIGSFPPPPENRLRFHCPYRSTFSPAVSTHFVQSLSWLCFSRSISSMIEKSSRKISRLAISSPPASRSRSSCREFHGSQTVWSAPAGKCGTPDTENLPRCALHQPVSTFPRLNRLLG